MPVSSCDGSWLGSLRRGDCLIALLTINKTTVFLTFPFTKWVRPLLFLFQNVLCMLSLKSWGNKNKKVKKERFVSLVEVTIVSFSLCEIAPLEFGLEREIPLGLGLLSNDRLITVFYYWFTLDTGFFFCSFDLKKRNNQELNTQGRKFFECLLWNIVWKLTPHCFLYMYFRLE